MTAVLMLFQLRYCVFPCCYGGILFTVPNSWRVNFKSLTSVCCFEEVYNPLTFSFDITFMYSKLGVAQPGSKAHTVVPITWSSTPEIQSLSLLSKQFVSCLHQKNTNATLLSPPSFSVQNSACVIKCSPLWDSWRCASQGQCGMRLVHSLPRDSYEVDILVYYRSPVVVCVPAIYISCSWISYWNCD